MAQKLGASFHFGQCTFIDTLEWAPAETAPDNFAPSGLDIDQWLDAAVTAGCQYAMLTAKHEGGFALWPTQAHAAGYEPYSIAQGAWYQNNGGRDIVWEFTESCRRHGLNPVLYLGIRDTTWQARTGFTGWSNPDEYIDYINAQLAELLTNYGPITAIWFDSWQWAVGRRVRVSPIYNLIKSLQPDCLLINNTQWPPYTQIAVHESAAVDPFNTVLAETIIQINLDGHWFWHPANVGPKPAETINAEIAFANQHNAAYLLNLTPSRAGVIPADQVARMAELHT